MLLVPLAEDAREGTPSGHVGEALRSVPGPTHSLHGAGATVFRVAAEGRPIDAGEVGSAVRVLQVFLEGRVEAGEFARYLFFYVLDSTGVSRDR